MDDAIEAGKDIAIAAASLYAAGKKAHEGIETLQNSEALEACIDRLLS
jgi:hypothetical protein